MWIVLKIKKVISLVLFICIMFLCIVLSVNANENISVFLNGRLINFDQPPIVQNGITLVPMQVIFEALGADVFWWDEAEYIIAIKNDIKLVLSPNENKIFKFIGKDIGEFEKKSNEGNLEGIMLDVAPQIINGRTLVPIRAISEAFGINVDWNRNSKSVLLTCDENFINDKNRDKTFVDDVMYLYSGFNSNKDNALPSYIGELPTEIQKLLKDIYNLHDGVEAYNTIVKQFGNPTGNKGGSGLYIPYWTLSNGTITFEIYYGVTYSNNTGTWDLSKRVSRFSAVMNQLIQVISLPDRGASTVIGYLKRDSDGTYSFSYNSRIGNEIKDFQKESFFIKNSKGKWNIEFVQGYDFYTRLEEVKYGTVIAYISFIGEENTITIEIKRDTWGIELYSDELKCELHNLPIRSPFTENYLPFL